MDQPVQKCENCLKQFPQSKMATHFGYCRRNIKKCSECGEMYDINAKEEHQQQFHKKVKCQFCKVQFPINDHKKHESSCSQKTEYCQYCQLNVPVKDYKTHLKLCQSRTKQCQKCKKSIPNKDYTFHIVDCRGLVENFPAYPTKQTGKIRTTNNRQSQPIQNDYYQQMKAGEMRKKNIFDKKEGKFLRNNNIQDSIDLQLQEKKKDSKKSEYTNSTYNRPPQRNYDKDKGGQKNYVNYVNQIKPSSNKLREESNAYRVPQKKIEYNKKTQEEVRGVKRLINQPKKQQIKKKPSNFDFYNRGQKNYDISSNIAYPKGQLQKKKTNINQPSQNTGINTRNKKKQLYEQYDFVPPQYQIDPYPMESRYFDDSNFGGSYGDFGSEQEYNMNKIIEQGFFNEKNKKNQKKQSNISDLSEDEQLQKALEEIYEQKKNKNRKLKDLPKQLQNSQIFKQFGNELDLEKQKALYEQYSKKNKYTNRR